jgi:NifU-like protein involved in Fe-S cluster formation
MVAGASIESNDEVISGEQLISSLESEIRPSRLKCALLALEALRSAVKSYRQSNPGR